MKRLLLLQLLIFSFLMGIYGQYKGEPWMGTPWNFSSDTLANFSVGKSFTHKQGPFNGIPFFAYDIGEVDPLKLPGEDPTGLLVAGFGTNVYVKDTVRQDDREIQKGGRTLTASDIATRTDPLYCAAFTTLVQRATFSNSGAWVRYSCSFEEGNYRPIMRVTAENVNNINQKNKAFWLRFYDRATMNPLTPWTRYHPAGLIEVLPSDSIMENAKFIKHDPDDKYQVIQEPYVNFGISRVSKFSYWIELDDIYSLNGEVVVEISDPGPVSEYGTNVGGNGIIGEITFLYTGPVEDKFAPVAEIYKDTWYDDLDTIKLSISEAGKLYIVPKGTLPDNLEEKAIINIELGINDKLIKPVSELSLRDEIQIVTTDASGNIRYTQPILLRNVLVINKNTGVLGDTIFGAVSRIGTLFMVPQGTPKDLFAFELAVASETGVSVPCSPDQDTLLILGNDEIPSGNYDLYVVDSKLGYISDAVSFTYLKETSSINKELNNKIVKIWTSPGFIHVKDAESFDQVSLYSITGQKILSQKIDSSEFNLNTSSFFSGLYILKLNNSISKIYFSGKVLID